MKISLAICILCSTVLGAFTLQCNKCLDLPDPRCEVVTCNKDELCKSVLSIIDNEKHTERSCSSPIFCGTSINSGQVKQSVICCKTDVCNNHTMPERLNGFKCHGCTDNECSQELRPIPCTANQEFCGWGFFQGTYVARQDPASRFPFRGCVSNEICALSVSSVLRLACCCGELCNRGPIPPRPGTLLIAGAAIFPLLYLAAGPAS